MRVGMGGGDEGVEETEGADGRSLGRCRRGGDAQDEDRRRWCGTMRDGMSDREQVGGGHRAVGGEACCQGCLERAGQATRVWQAGARRQVAGR